MDINLVKNAHAFESFLSKANMFMRKELKYHAGKSMKIP